MSKLYLFIFFFLNLGGQNNFYWQPGIFAGYKFFRNSWSLDYNYCYEIKAALNIILNTPAKKILIWMVSFGKDPSK